MLKILPDITGSLKILWLIFLLLTGIWNTGVIYYNLPLKGWKRSTAALTFIAACLIVIILSFRGNTMLILDLTVLQLLLIWYFITLTPSKCFKNTKWQVPWKRNPTAVFEPANTVTIHNIRDFNYRSVNDYDVNYISDRLNLAETVSLDLAVSHWDNLESIAHTMLSFEFANGKRLVFSVETRLPENTEQGFLPGLYKQFELLIIIGTENDLFKLRTNYRNEKLYLYRTNASAEQARSILHALLLAANRHVKHPQFYNSLTSNCTTSLIPMLRQIKPSFPGDIRLMLNGYSDEFLFKMGYLAKKSGETFAELKQRSLVNQYLNIKEEYSRAIRSGM